MEIEVKGLTKYYGKQRAVDGFTASFQEGINGLLGANGSGKTTLMRIMCDLLRPSEGEVLLNGVNVRAWGENFRDMLGYLPQNFGYYPDFSAWDFMMYLAALKGLPKARARERCDDLLHTVELHRVRRNKIKTFSGGMRQKLGIAQALINDPKILILDEPTTGLDPKERARFRNIISQHSQNRIVLLSTHIVADVENIADRVYIMKDGSLLQEGPVAQLTMPLENMVWTCKVEAALADELSNHYIISNLKHQGREVELRMVAPEKPTASALSVPANLEDLYLYYFQEQNEEPN